MHRLIFSLLFIEFISCQNLYPLTPIEFRGLWCIVQGIDNQRQLGQAFFYNNGTFTLNFLNNIQYTWINHFVGITKTDNQGTYRVLTDTTQGPGNYVNKTSCFWRRQISNGDIIWGQQSNGTCTKSFEIDNSENSIRYTRNGSKCFYVDDEDTNQILSDTEFEPELIVFDKSLENFKPQSIVFYGSSSIRLWSTLTTDFSNLQYDVINRGFGGSTIKQCYEQFKRVILPLEPRLLIIYAGENDIAENQTSATILPIFHQLFQRIRRFFPSLPLVYISIKPSPYRINQIFQQNLTNYLIKEEIKYLNNIVYIDVFNQLVTNAGQLRPELYDTDNLHMNQQGYAIWTREIQNYLRTNGYISKGPINCQISLVLFLLNILTFFTK